MSRCCPIPRQRPPAVRDSSIATHSTHSGKLSDAPPAVKPTTEPHSSTIVCRRAVGSAGSSDSHAAPARATAHNATIHRCPRPERNGHHVVGSDSSDHQLACPSATTPRAGRGKSSVCRFSSSADAVGRLTQSAFENVGNRQRFDVARIRSSQRRAFRVRTAVRSPPITISGSAVTDSAIRLTRCMNSFRGSTRGTCPSHTAIE